MSRGVSKELAVCTIAGRVSTAASSRRPKPRDYTVAMAFQRVRPTLLTTTVCSLTLALTAFGSPRQQEHQPEAGAHRQPEAAKANPVPTTPESVAAGKAIFDKNCASCHGKSGRGDGRMGEELNPKPANLTDAEWKHGSTDGDIFNVIHDGVPKTGMKPFGRKLSEHEIWDTVNFIRSIGPPTRTR